MFGLFKNKHKSKVKITDKKSPSKIKIDTKTRVIKTKVAGVTFTNSDGTDRQTILKSCSNKESLVLKCTNVPGHPNAVGVYRKSGKQLGFVPSHLSGQIARAISSRKKVTCKILNLTGGGLFKKKTRGCNIEIKISSK